MKISRIDKIIMIILLIFVLLLIIKYQIPKNNETNDIKNISELYSQTNSLSKEYLQYKLNIINCNPQEYYNYKIKNNAFVCFNCENIVCFPFVKNNNIQFGEPIFKSKEINNKIADMYFNQLASNLNCNKENENTLNCGNSIYFTLNRSKDDNIHSSDISLILRDLTSWKEAANIICSTLTAKENTCLYDNNICNCNNNYNIYLEKNNIIIEEV